MATTSNVPFADSLKAFEELRKQLDLLTPAARLAGDQLKQSTEAALAPLKAVTDAIQRFQAGINNVKGAVSGVFGQIGSIIQTAYGPALAAVKDTFGAVGQVVGSTLGPVVGVAAKAFGAVGSVLAEGASRAAGAFGSLVPVLGGVVDAVAGVGQQLGQFVALANPGVFLLFQRAVADLMASIGQGLAPILELITGNIRAVADVFSALAPAGKAVADAMKPVFTVAQGMIRQFGASLVRFIPAVQAMAAAFAEIVLAAAPLYELLMDLLGAAIRGLGSVIQAVAPYIAAFARVVGELVRSVVNWIGDLLGLPKLDPVKKDQSVGAAAAQAQVGGVQDVFKRAYQSAFSLGTGMKPDEETAKNTKQLVERVNEIANILRNPGGTLAKRVQDATGIKTGYEPGSVADISATAARALGDPLGTGVSLIRGAFR